MAETTWLDATAQADLVRRGEVSPKELAEAAIARIEAVNPRLDAVIRTRFEAARLEADGDLPDSPFRGVPILYKDVACMVAGQPTAFGLGPLREMAWPATSYLAEQFRAAGFVPLGRTNTAEIATSATTEPRSFPPARAPPLPRPLVREAGADPGRLRIGVLDRPGAEGFVDDPQCRAAVAGAARLLESFGHHVEQSAPAAMFEPEFTGHFDTLIAAGAEATFQAFERLLGRPIGEEEIEPRNAACRRSGRALGAVAHLGSRLWLSRWARRMAHWWNDHDLLVTPTLGAPPPELGWFTAAGPQQEKERNISFIRYTAPFNMTGQPAISLPLHWTPAGLPVGAQLAAAYGREDLLIRVASQLEQAAPWSDRHPPVHA